MPENSLHNFLKPGTVIQSPTRAYTIVKVLGQGGFGITYLVESAIKIENIEVKVKFALKEHFINNLCSRDGETQRVLFSKPVAEQVQNSLKAFIKEANRLRDLDFRHPNIVQVNEVFSANDTAYYVMEYLEGQTLDAYVAEHGKLSEQQTMSLMMPLIEAVGALHQNRITHYDIKPANIVLTKDGEDGSIRPVLIDFGLAKHYDEKGNATSTINATGYTPGYAAAEQYMGIRDFTPQCDVYSLAATMYFCLTGSSPAPAIDFVVTDLPKLLPGVSHTTVSAMTHAMQMHRSQRSENATVLHSELSQSTPPPSIPTTPQIISVPTAFIQEDIQEDDDNYEEESSSKKPVVITICAVAVIALACAIYFMCFSSESSSLDDLESGRYDVDEALVDSVVMTSTQYDDTTDETFIAESDEEELPEKDNVTEVIIVEDKPAATSTNEIQEQSNIKEEEPAPKKEDNTVYDVVEDPPTFPGGTAALYSFLSNNMRYPAQAQEEGVSGRVLVKFTVTKTGSVTNVTVARGKHPALDAEAVRVVKMMPKWNPGRKNGQPVNVSYNLPVTFKLQQ